MLGDLAVLYLFLGGAGAGCVTTCALVDLAWLREPFGVTTAYGPEPAADPARRAAALGFAAGLGALVAGAACLSLDLGRIDRVLALFLSPQPTVMSVGAVALAALIAVAAPLAAVRLLYLPGLPRPAVRALEALAVALGLVVMAYTGLLLQSLQGAGLWRSPWLPVLFTLSSASSGVALVMACCFWAGADARTARLLRVLARADGVLIAAEVAAAALFAGTMASSAHPGAAAGAAALLAGPQAAAWWLGFGLCGCALPLGAEAAYLLAGRRLARGPAPAALPALAAVLVLAGALCLRWAVADAAAPRDLALQAPPPAASPASAASPAPAGPPAASPASLAPGGLLAGPPGALTLPALGTPPEREDLIAP